MNGWDRFSAQMMTDKLDRNLITLAEAKRFAAHRMMTPDMQAARTKTAFIRALWKANREFADQITSKSTV